jgi:hypothetical protein
MGPLVHDQISSNQSNYTGFFNAHRYLENAPVSDIQAQICGLHHPTAAMNLRILSIIGPLVFLVQKSTIEDH